MTEPEAPKPLPESVRTKLADLKKQVEVIHKEIVEKLPEKSAAPDKDKEKPKQLEKEAQARIEGLLTQIDTFVASLTDEEKQLDAVCTLSAKAHDVRQALEREDERTELRNRLIALRAHVDEHSRQPAPAKANDPEPEKAKTTPSLVSDIVPQEDPARMNWWEYAKHVTNSNVFSGARWLLRQALPLVSWIRPYMPATNPMHGAIMDGIREQAEHFFAVPNARDELEIGFNRPGVLHVVEGSGDSAAFRELRTKYQTARTALEGGLGGQPSEDRARELRNFTFYKFLHDEAAAYLRAVSVSDVQGQQITLRGVLDRQRPRGAAPEDGAPVPGPTVKKPDVKKL